jgi:hypothetical protein
MNCPSCGEMIGFWQAPLKAEEKNPHKDNLN